MNKKILYSIAGLVALTGAAFAVKTTQAFGLGFQGSDWHTKTEAQVLHTTPEQLQADLDTKTLPDILSEHNMTQEQFQEAIQEKSVEQLRTKGLTEEQIQQRLTERQTHMDQRQQALANLMNIDTSTLEKELATNTLPELLDKYEVSHVALHDAFKDLEPTMAGRGMGMMH